MAKKIRKIKLEGLEGLISKLQELPTKEKSNFSAREAVIRAEPALSPLLKRGYSYDDLVRLLGESGIKIKRGTLQTYLREGRRQNQDGENNQYVEAVEVEQKAKRSQAKPTEAEKVGNFLEMDEENL